VTLSAIEPKNFAQNSRIKFCLLFGVNFFIEPKNCPKTFRPKLIYKINPWRQFLALGLVGAQDLALADGLQRVQLLQRHLGHREVERHLGRRSGIIFLLEHSFGYNVILSKFDLHTDWKVAERKMLNGHFGPIRHFVVRKLSIRIFGIRPT
jgi:hypothetical protein